MRLLRLYLISVSVFLFVVCTVSSQGVAAVAGSPESLLYRAEHGDCDAQCYLGHLYLSGKGVTQDFGKAKYWYGKVIDNEGADAKIVAHANFVMGRLYASGKGGIQNYKTALQCFKIAAQQGYTDAHINIGLLYAKGLGVRRDYHQALYWWELAALKGHPTAPKYVRQLKKKIEAEG